MDEDNSVTATPGDAAPESDSFGARLKKRADELQETGLSWLVAYGMAELEERIASWPEGWGDDLKVLIYGDFDAPSHDLDFPTLGITVEAGKLTETIIKTALCVVRARVKVREKSLSALLDAVTRLNTFVGIWTIIDWGNRGPGWWCHITHGGMAGGGGPLALDGIEEAIAGIERLRPDVKRKVRAALHWIQEPTQMMRERFRNGSFRVFAGYWNAFECLVDAVCLLRPLSKMKKQEKRDRMSQYLAERQGKLDVGSLGECYRLFVDPGFVAKASHALRLCCPDRADGYIIECFRAKPVDERLYAVRNAINHGDIDSDSLQEMMRVEDKLRRLKMIVFAMLGQLIPFSYPLDSGPR